MRVDKVERARLVVDVEFGHGWRDDDELGLWCRLAQQPRAEALERARFDDVLRPERTHDQPQVELMEESGAADIIFIVGSVGLRANAPFWTNAPSSSSICSREIHSSPILQTVCRTFGAGVAAAGRRFGIIAAMRRLDADATQMALARLNGCTIATPTASRGAHSQFCLRRRVHRPSHGAYDRRMQAGVASKKADTAVSYRGYKNCTDNPKWFGKFFMKPGETEPVSQYHRARARSPPPF